jgi:nitroreductase
MDIIDAIYQRMSIRDFLPDPVPAETLERILTAACRSPSAMNSQPWEFVVLTGAPLDRIREENVSRLDAGEPPASEHSVVGWPRESIYRRRQVDLAKALFKEMGIGREEAEKRREWTRRGFRFFDAPAAVILVSDRQLSGEGPLLDLGAAMQTLCLAALAHGLGTCIEDQGVMYPSVVRKHAGISDDKRIIIGIAIGTPNPDFPANRVRTDREPVDRITSWVGFD